MFFQHPAFAAGARATLPVLLGIIPFGVITGVASAQLLASSAPAALIASPRFAQAPLAFTRRSSA